MVTEMGSVLGDLGGFETTANFSVWPFDRLDLGTFAEGCVFLCTFVEF